MAESALEPLLTPENLVELGIYPSVKTLYTQRSGGKPTPRAIRIGKHLRFKPSDVRAFLDAQTEAAA